MHRFSRVLLPVILLVSLVDTAASQTTTTLGGLTTVTSGNVTSTSVTHLNISGSDRKIQMSELSKSVLSNLTLSPGLAFTGSSLTFTPVAGPGISVSGATITNTGLLTLAIGSGLSGTVSSGAVTLSNSGLLSIAVDTSGRLSAATVSGAVTISSILNGGNGITISGTNISLSNVISSTTGSLVTGTITNLFSTTGSLTTLTATSLFSTTGSLTTGTIASLFSTTGSITTLTASGLYATTGIVTLSNLVINRTGDGTVSTAGLIVSGSSGVVSASIGGMYFGQSSGGTWRTVTALGGTTNFTGTSIPYGFSMETGGGINIRTSSARYIDFYIDATQIGGFEPSGFVAMSGTTDLRGSALRLTTSTITTTTSGGITTTDTANIFNSSSAFTKTMPAASQTGRFLAFYNSGAGTVTLTSSGVGNINGTTNQAILTGSAALLWADGANWYGIIK